MLRRITTDRFDTTLDLSGVERGYHANLYIHLKVSLHKFEPPPGEAYLRYQQSDDQSSRDIVVVHWPAGNAWPDWCRQFERDAERFFNNKLWQIPGGPWLANAPVPGSQGRQIYTPGIRCGLRITRVPIDQAHLICDVA